MSSVAEKPAIIETNASPFSLDNINAYEAWRAQKLADYPTESAQLVVDIPDFSHPSSEELQSIYRLLAKTNMAVYADKNPSDDPETTRKAIRKFADMLGLDFAEAHRSAGEQRLVALEVSNEGTKRGYIPYSNKPLNWHTDGYYNGPEEEIGTFILHCARNAAEGGVSQLLDPEIAYIRLRDENPEFITALSHPEAMTIPFNTEPDGSIRPDSIGPVFKPLSDNSAMTMRFTARTRSISWRDDPLTREAVSFLNHLLDNNEPLIFTAKLAPGQGVINNNVLHNRTGFENNNIDDTGRLLYRIRFLQRIDNPAQ